MKIDVVLAAMVYLTDFNIYLKQKRPGNLQKDNRKQHKTQPPKPQNDMFLE